MLIIQQGQEESRRIKKNQEESRGYHIWRISYL